MGEGRAVDSNSYPNNSLWSLAPQLQYTSRIRRMRHFLVPIQINNLPEKCRRTSWRERERSGSKVGEGASGRRSKAYILHSKTPEINSCILVCSNKLREKESPRGEYLIKINVIKEVTGGECTNRDGGHKSKRKKIYQPTESCLVEKHYHPCCCLFSSMLVRSSTRY